MIIICLNYRSASIRDAIYSLNHRFSMRKKNISHSHVCVQLILPKSIDFHLIFPFFFAIAKCPLNRKSWAKRFTRVFSCHVKADAVRYVVIIPACACAYWDRPLPFFCWYKVDKRRNICYNLPVFTFWFFISLCRCSYTACIHVYLPYIGIGRRWWRWRVCGYNDATFYALFMGTVGKSKIEKIHFKLCAAHICVQTITIFLLTIQTCTACAWIASL